MSKSYDEFVEEYGQRNINLIFNLEKDEMYAMVSEDDIENMLQEVDGQCDDFEHLRFYDNDEEFLNTMFSTPLEAVRSALFGDYRYDDAYVRFDGYRNMESIDDVSAEIKKWDEDIFNKFIEFYQDGTLNELPAVLENFIDEKAPAAGKGW